MDIIELRIGNLILLGNNITEVVSLDLDLEDEGEPLIKVDTFKNIKSPIGGYWKEYVELNYTHFYPIPLTEDWLLKFGFDKENNDLFDDWFDFTKGKVTIYYDSSKGEFIYLGTSIQVKHVHQLQNLFFSLSGEELELK